MASYRGNNFRTIHAELTFLKRSGSGCNPWSQIDCCRMKLAGGGSANPRELSERKTKEREKKKLLKHAVQQHREISHDAG